MRSTAATSSHWVTISTALMHGVDADIAGQSLGSGCFAYPDAHWGRAGAGPQATLLAIAIAGTQIIEVRHRDRGQSGIARIAEALVGPDEQRLGGRTRKRVVQAVEFSEQRHVLGAILACIAGAAGPTARAKRLRLSIAGQQARQMLPRIARQPLQVSEEHPALLLG